MKGAWPTINEVQTALAGAGINVPAGFAVADIVGSVIAEWERQTGVSPWLASGTNSERSFDAPFDEVLMTGPFLTLESVLFDGVTVDDVYPVPTDAPGKGLPYTGLQFCSIVVGPPAGIVVSANWGASSGIPLDVWEAALNLMVYRCGALAYSAAYGSTTGPVTSIRQDQVAYSFCPSGSDSPKTAFDRLARQYRVI